MLPLTSAGRRWLLEVARRSLEAAGRRAACHLPEPPSGLPAADREQLERPLAAFVSLYKEGQLRGCIGHVAADLPLTRVVAEMTRAAALEDTRFDPVSAEEVPQISVEISVLSPLFPIRPAEIVAGTHGLVVRQDERRGLLLPQVAADRHWDAEQVLRETCRKAGLPPDAWKTGATLEAFTADIIAEGG